MTSVEALQRYAERKTEAALNGDVQRVKGKNLDGQRRFDKRREKEKARAEGEAELIGL